MGLQLRVKQRPPSYYSKGPHAPRRSRHGKEVGHRDKTGLRVEEMAVADRVKGDYPVQLLPAQIEPLNILIVQKLLAGTGEPVLA